MSERRKHDLGHPPADTVLVFGGERTPLYPPNRRNGERRRGERRKVQAQPVAIGWLGRIFERFSEGGPVVHVQERTGNDRREGGDNV